MPGIPGGSGLRARRALKPEPPAMPRPMAGCPALVPFRLPGAGWGECDRRRARCCCDSVCRGGPTLDGAPTNNWRCYPVYRVRATKKSPGTCSARSLSRLPGGGSLIDARVLRWSELSRLPGTGTGITVAAGVASAVRSAGEPVLADAEKAPPSTVVISIPVSLSPFLLSATAAGGRLRRSAALTGEGRMLIDATFNVLCCGSRRSSPRSLVLSRTQG